MENSVASIIKKIGIGIIITGILGGIIWATDDVLNEIFNSDFVFSVAITTWINAFVAGMLFVGFSEIISILHNQNKTAEENQKVHQKILLELQERNKAVDFPNNEKEMDSNQNHNKPTTPTTNARKKGQTKEKDICIKCGEEIDSNAPKKFVDGNYEHWVCS